MNRPYRFDSNKYSRKSSKVCALEVYLEYCKELHELHIDYPLAPDKIKIKREILSNYQLKMNNFLIFLFALLYLMPNVFDKSMCFIVKLMTLFKTQNIAKKIHRV